MGKNLFLSHILVLICALTIALYRAIRLSRHDGRRCSQAPALLLLALLAALHLPACSVAGDEALPSPDSSGGGSSSPSVAQQEISLRDFNAQTLDGESFGAEDIAAYDLTLVHFWGVSCKPCVEELPQLAEYARGLPDNVQLITVCMDAQQGGEHVRELLDTAGYEGVTLVSGDDGFFECWANVRYTPMTVAIGPDGSQLGEPIIGTPDDLEGTYDALVSSALG